MFRQTLPYEMKIEHAKLIAREFYEKLGGKVYCSVGGLDSITLLLFLQKHVNKDIPGASVSALEDRSIQKIHRQLSNIVFLRPGKLKTQVIKEFGYPVVSKEKAKKISILQIPDSPKQTFIHAIMTGDMGAQGGFKHSNKIKLPEKWIKLFGGLYNHHRPELICKTAPFRVSADCCYHMKEKPCNDFAKKNKLFPYMGLMASEGGQREKGLRKNGCNYFGKTVTRSCPFAIFSKSDLLRLALELDVPVPEIYGEIVLLPNGTLDTTRAKRTGCTMCGFGIHMEKRPHRFDRLREDSPAEWNFWMYKWGWGKVLNYIGVGWEDKIS